MNRIMTLCASFLLSCIMGVSVFAQGGYEVKGVVVDAIGPVIGATVIEQGTTNGTSTGLDGDYVLTVSSADAVVEISCIGYASQTFVASQVPPTVTLSEDTQFLDEVVVIGYGTVKKEDMTGSITAIKSEELNRGAMVNTQEMLKGIDVMVYDIQDVGVRSYTYISTLGLVMEACAEKGIEVIVLDRPNPLGGNKIEGCYVEPGFHSFVSQYKIPYVYGLTPGEVAILINEEGLNRGQKGDQEPVKCRLTVVPMEGWTRDMLYEDTGLPWVLPSPNIPFKESPMYYASSGIMGELYGFMNIGIGYTLPFQIFGALWLDPEKLKERLESYELPGISFRTIWYKPYFGSLAGKLVKGLQFFFTDYEKARLTDTQFYVMQAVAELYPDKKSFEVANGIGLFDKVCGTDYVRKEFVKRYKVADVIEYWRKDEEEFREMSRQYHIY